MIAVVCAAVGIGLGVIGLLAAARRRRPRLAEMIADVEADVSSGPGRGPRSAWAGGARNMRLDRRFGGTIAQAFEKTPVALRLETDLFLTDRTLESLCAESVLGAVAGFVLPVVCWMVAAWAGFRWIPVAPAAVGLVLGCAGALIPILAVSSEARRARSAARRCIGSFVDLAVLALAGGMGLESALEAAAQVGDQPGTRKLRRALAFARGAGEPPWVPLQELGRRCGLDELIELAAALKLAGREGARIRASLSAKAESMRRSQLLSAEAAANRASERLFLPGVLLLIGFLLFIGYPAMARITIGL